ncbi:hypothetical protein RA210_U10532 [Rubrivivax sp. A210]|uniref:hypothetical protein n=1 Tax=Rubrivivax sp. A210 TaxID=2772301 RepID=UPI00191B69E2|nr:hypothetical protein [Rubrivivax sp. A210]CAD5366851.1 hypothetical protein RA210_U10532 [Rubrivivax sp. A210]
MTHMTPVDAMVLADTCARAHGYSGIPTDAGWVVTAILAAANGTRELLAHGLPALPAPQAPMQILSVDVEI